MKKFIVLAVAMMVTFALALPATAQDKADWSFYGSVRMWTAWESVDEDTPSALASTGGGFFQVGSTKAIALTYGDTAQDDDEVAWLLQGNSRIGANVKWGNVGGRFEYGSGPNLRLLYGTWDFGPGTLLVGQDYGAFFYLITSMCGVGGAECSGIGYGSIYSGRTPQIKLMMGGFKFNLSTSGTTASYRSAVGPGDTILPATTLLQANVRRDTDQLLPKVEASYTFNLGPAQIFLGGIYNSYKEVYEINTQERENTVNGWALAAATKMGFGPFYVNASFIVGRNPNNSGSGPYTVYPSVMLYDPTTDNSEDAKYWNGMLILGFKLSDAIAFEGGFIMQQGKVGSLVGLGDFKQTTYAYYLQMTWSPAKNVYFIPEIGMTDWDKLKIQDAELDYGKTTWLGIKWMINF